MKLRKIIAKGSFTGPDGPDTFENYYYITDKEFGQPDFFEMMNPDGTFVFFEPKRIPNMTTYTVEDLNSDDVKELQQAFTLIMDKLKSRLTKLAYVMQSLSTKEPQEITTTTA